ncbi:hypothetical protein RchiOBHm_Chr4g0439061 [Rosa chinensis]|uniref:Uncharacterized protein n=1 Tax=Rosa chinensis TaxID=74649 RepID=A0A2P6R2Q1_ROSCH|nr:hypothetical protein RchiOBHm_Chr4g0439061 [Rosa chinensis]
MGVARRAMVILVRSSRWKMQRLCLLSSQEKSMATSRRSWWWVGVLWQIARPWLRVLQYLSQIRRYWNWQRWARWLVVYSAVVYNCWLALISSGDVWWSAIRGDVQKFFVLWRRPCLWARLCSYVIMGTNLTMCCSSWPESELWLWKIKVDAGIDSYYLLLVFCFFRFSSLVFWLGLLSLYSLEIGFGIISGMVVLLWCHSQRLLELFSVSSYGRVLKGVIFFLRLAMRRYGDFWVGLSDELLLWRYFRGLYVILSVVFGGQYGSDLSLYVVWILWDIIWRRMTWLLVLAARFYRDSRDWYCYVA